MNFNDFAIVSVKGSDFRIDFCYMSKNDAINIMKTFTFIIFTLYTKMSEKFYDQRNRDVILNRAKDYYKNDKERLKHNGYREMNTEVYLKKEKIKRENMEKINTMICLEKILR